MDPVFDSLSDIKPGREAWRIRVRVIRLWKVPAFLSPGHTNSIEMVLVDDMVCLVFFFLCSLFFFCYFSSVPSLFFFPISGIFSRVSRFMLPFGNSCCIVLRERFSRVSL